MCYHYVEVDASRQPWSWLLKLSWPFCLVTDVIQPILGSFFPIALHCVSFFLVLHYCVFSFLIFSLLATSSVNRIWIWIWNLHTNDLSAGWWSGVVVSALASINEVNQHRARLVLRWVTISGFNSRWGTFISVCDKLPRSTQPGHPFVGRRNEYQPKGGDALRLGSKGRYGSCVGGR